MGKTRKPFIAKGEGQKFVLCHRSLTDGAYAGEETPSDYVLIPVDQVTGAPTPQHLDQGLQNRVQQKKRQSVSFQDDMSVNSSRSLLTMGSHVTELGFKNDGYDYSKHLKEMGGGYFVGTDGSVSLSQRHNGIQLPAEVLPSNLQVIV